MKATGSDRSGGPALVLFRHDLRIADNRALCAAVESGRSVVCAYIHDCGQTGARTPGAASRWWLHHSLASLAASLEAAGAPLVLRKGSSQAAVQDLIRETGAAAVYWNRHYDPAQIKTDAAMKAALRESGVEADDFEGQLLHEPSRVRTGAGGPFRVYTPFWRALEREPEPRDPLPAPKRIESWPGRIEAVSLQELSLLPSGPDWAAGLRETWTPGEAGAKVRLSAFVDAAVTGYTDDRDRPDIEGTSRLSPHLAHGEITPFQIFGALRAAGSRVPAGDAEKFRKEICWREFSYHLLFHNPDLAERNFNPDFDAFPWTQDEAALKAWQNGRTGYPIVDAGMRQLWQTGWMHNRVRMIVASFLVKHLRVDWRKGERWFWDTLVDADPASNPASWQWVAGSGADAAPYFRIFNPMLQGAKFDPDGAYVRRFVPELGQMPPAFIHSPWEAPAQILKAAGVKLGTNYPVPVVQHQQARDRAMAAYATIRGHR